MEEISLDHLEFDLPGTREDIDIPPDPNSEWCDTINAFFGNKGYRVIVTAGSYIRRQALTGRMQGHKRLETISPNGAGVGADRHAFEGAFMGLALRPDPDSGDLSQRVLYAVMKDANDISANTSLSPEDWVDYLVPVHNTRTLVLMRRPAPTENT